MMPSRDGMPPTFLVNCYGMAWEEVTASSIIESQSPYPFPQDNSA